MRRGLCLCLAAAGLPASDHRAWHTQSHIQSRTPTCLPLLRLQPQPLCHWTFLWGNSTSHGTWAVRGSSLRVASVKSGAPPLRSTTRSTVPIIPNLGPAGQAVAPRLWGSEDMGQISSRGTAAESFGCIDCWYVPCVRERSPSATWPAGTRPCSDCVGGQPTTTARAANKLRPLSRKISCYQPDPSPAAARGHSNVSSYLC